MSRGLRFVVHLAGKEVVNLSRPAVVLTHIDHQMYGLRILFLLLRFLCLLMLLFQQHGEGLIRGLTLMLPLSLYFYYVADRLHSFGIEDFIYLICFDPLLELILTGDLRSSVTFLL